MTTTVTDNPSASRYEIALDGQLAGSLEYHLHSDLAAFIHTEIAPEFGGQGLATILVRASLDDARAKGRHVEPFCRFVRAFIADNAEYRALVPDPERFGLQGA